MIAKIIARFEERGYKLVGMKAMVPSRELAEQHYADLKGRPFFNNLVDYMTNGKVWGTLNLDLLTCRVG